MRFLLGKLYITWRHLGLQVHLAHLDLLFASQVQSQSFFFYNPEEISGLGQVLQETGGL